MRGQKAVHMGGNNFLIIFKCYPVEARLSFEEGCACFCYNELTPIPRKHTNRIALTSQFRNRCFYLSDWVKHAGTSMHTSDSRDKGHVGDHFPERQSCLVEKVLVPQRFPSSQIPARGMMEPALRAQGHG